MENFFWVGERLWIDAVNSEGADTNGQRIEFWNDPARLEGWARQARQHHAEAKALHNFSSRDEELLFEAKRLRAALRLACETTHASGITSKDIDSEAVNTINNALHHRGVVLHVEKTAEGWHEVEEPSGEATDVLWLIARSAARSWSRGELARLKPCGNPDCILWFLDTSKNGTRRWCSMQGCGNRHKVAAHYKRKSGARS